MHPRRLRQREPEQRLEVGERDSPFPPGTREKIPIQRGVLPSVDGPPQTFFPGHDARQF